MNKLHLSTKILLYSLIILLLGIIFFFHDSKLALAATTVSGVGTGTLELTGTGNGTLVFYKGDTAPSVYGDSNCSYQANCTWTSTAGSGFGYGTGDPIFYFLDGVNGSTCSGSTYEECSAVGGVGVVGVGCYVTNGSTWSEGTEEQCGTTTQTSTSTATSTPYNDPVQNIFFGWVVFSLTAWGVISFFNKRYG